MSSDWKRTRMDNKIVVITGANSGLGKASTEDLAKRGAKVYMVGRYLESTENAAKDVVRATNVSPELIQVMSVDLSSLQSVREFAAKFREKETHIDVLMNNAGIMAVPQSTTKDGFEAHFGTNVLGHFLLTHLLMDMLIAGAPGSRVVNLSSVTHKFGKKEINWDDLMFENSYSPTDAYSQSKLAIILFNLELSKRVKEAGITCYAVHPGVVNTNLASQSVGVIKCLFCFRCCFTSPEDGAQTQVRCSIDPGYWKETGCYYADCKRTQPSRQAQSEDSALRLWNICLELVKLTPDEIHDILR